MITQITTNKYDRDFKRVKRQGKKMSKLAAVIKLLLEEQTLPEKYCDHRLLGTDKRDCHITDKWLLIYTIIEDKGGARVLKLLRTGKHDEVLN